VIEEQQAAFDDQGYVEAREHTNRTGGSKVRENPIMLIFPPQNVRRLDVAVSIASGMQRLCHFEHLP
jgi:hypothetical protein